MLDQTNNIISSNKTAIMVEFCDVSYQVANNQLVNNLSCQILHSGITVLMGPNGAGKSLFLRLLAGLIVPNSGTIKFRQNSDRDKNANSIAIVFQNPVLLRRNAFDNVAYVLSHFAFSNNQIKEKVSIALAAARLEKRAKTPARLLSGGEKQRLALARALVLKPSGLLLDEATASLDPASIHIVESMVRDVAKNGTKVIFVSHDVRQAKRIADDILFLDGGKALAHKATKEFFREPGSVQAQAYLDGRISD